MFLITNNKLAVHIQSYPTRINAIGNEFVFDWGTAGVTPSVLVICYL